MKKSLLFGLIIFIHLPLAAESPRFELSAGFGLNYLFPNQSGYGYENRQSVPVEYGEQSAPSPPAFSNQRSLGNNSGSFKFAVFCSAALTIPCSLGDSPILSSGNIRLEGDLRVSPVSISLSPEIIWSPLPFLEIGGGILAGTGWYATDIDANGLGLNENENGIADRNQGGLIYNPYLSLKFQMDTAAIFPGDWNHIIFQAKGILNFPRYSLAEEDEAWVWNNDNGENFNGAVLKTEWTVGYLMPRIPLRILAFRWETTERLGKERGISTLADHGWGSDFVTQEFGPLLVIQPGDAHRLILQAQWATERHYRNDTVFQASFRNREAAGKTYVYFQGITLAYRFTIY